MKHKPEKTDNPAKAGRGLTEEFIKELDALLAEEEKQKALFAEPETRQHERGNTDSVLMREAYEKLLADIRCLFTYSDVIDTEMRVTDHEDRAYGFALMKPSEIFGRKPEDIQDDRVPCFVALLNGKPEEVYFSLGDELPRVNRDSDFWRIVAEWDSIVQAAAENVREQIIRRIKQRKKIAEGGISRENVKGDSKR